MDVSFLQDPMPYGQSFEAGYEHKHPTSIDTIIRQDRITDALNTANIVYIQNPKGYH